MKTSCQERTNGDVFRILRFTMTYKLVGHSLPDPVHELPQSVGAPSTTHYSSYRAIANHVSCRHRANLPQSTCMMSRSSFAMQHDARTLTPIQSLTVRSWGGTDLYSCENPEALPEYLPGRAERCKAACAPVLTCAARRDKVEANRITPDARELLIHGICADYMLFNPITGAVSFSRLVSSLRPRPL
jgi:hypothetical protein